MKRPHFHRLSAYRSASIQSTVSAISSDRERERIIASASAWERRELRAIGLRRMPRKARAA